MAACQMNPALNLLVSSAKWHRDTAPHPRFGDGMS